MRGDIGWTPGGGWMNRTVVGVRAWAGQCLCVLCLLVLARGVSAQSDAQLAAAAQMRTMRQLRTLSMAAMMHAADSSDRLPASMADLLPYVLPGGAGGGNMDAAAAREAFFGLHDPTRTPEQVDGAWIEKNSSFRYIGTSVRMGVLAAPDRVVLAHLRLDRPIPTDDPENPTGEVFALAFADGHVETHSRAQAEALIAQSRALFEALAAGASLPEVFQASADVRLIVEALRAFAAANGGLLPRSLGEALEQVPQVPGRTDTARLRASIFVAPRARAGLFIPEEPTAEWVDRNTSYAYLGACAEGQPAIRLEAIEAPSMAVLVHTKPELWMEDPAWNGDAARRLAMGHADGESTLISPQRLQSLAAANRALLSAARGEGELPPYFHMHRDLRLVSEAVRAHARAHGGALPSDLGEIVDEVRMLLPEGGRGDADVARVFLSPEAERRWGDWSEVGVVDRAWVVGHANYGFPAAGGGLKLRDLTSEKYVVLVHGPMGEAVELAGFLGGPGDARWVPMVFAQGRPMAQEVTTLGLQLAEDVRVLARARSGHGKEPARRGER